MATEIKGDQSPKSAQSATPAFTPDVVVMRDHEGKLTQFFIGQAVNWPGRKAPIDANRMENAMVESVAMEAGQPVVRIRSLSLGQTATLVGISSGVMISYGPLPVPKQLKDAEGNVIGEEYPLPAGCVRQGSNIISAALVK